MANIGKIGVSQKAVIYKKDKKILILHRTLKAPSNPDYWDLPGGALDFGEDAASGMKREIKEETGLIIKKIKPYDIESHIDDDNEFWVTIAYVCKYKSGKIKLSFEHDKYLWINKTDINKYRFSKKIKKFIINYFKYEI